MIIKIKHPTRVSRASIYYYQSTYFYSNRYNLEIMGLKYFTVGEIRKLSDCKINSKRL